MRQFGTAFALILLLGGHEAHAERPAVAAEFWINELLPEDLRHFEAIKLATRAISVTIKRPDSAVVRRQRVDVKGDYQVVQVTELLQAVLGPDDSYWNTRDPLTVGIVGDSYRTIVNTSRGSGPRQGSSSSYVYTLEDGKWRSLYHCCRKSN